MQTTRRLIINGDDFGQTAGTTFGVALAHERGVLTSASLMVRWPAAVAAAAYASVHPSLAVGLHFDFGEWVYGDHTWQALYKVTALDDPHEIEAEAWRQLDRFREFLGRWPTHLDSHQHVHRLEPVRAVLLAIAQRLSVPLRDYTAGVRYCGDFYGQTEKGTPWPAAISVEALLGIIGAAPPGVTEIACHPASANDVRGMYREERQLELQTLCDPRIRACLRDENIALESFGDLRREDCALTAAADDPIAAATT